MKRLAAACLTLMPLAAAELPRAADWPVAASVVESGKTHRISYWRPAEEVPRALVLAVENFAEPRFCVDPAVRRVCREASLGIALVEGNPFGAHDPPGPAWGLLDALLQALEQESGTRGLASVPLIPFGHSAAGPWARNLAFHQPRRVAAVIYFKSGQFVPPPWAHPDGFRVPVLALNGQYEEFGPRGDHQPGDDWQGQWLAMRDQLAVLRGKGMRAALAVEPGGGHYCWSGRQMPLVGAYLRAVSNAIGAGRAADGSLRFPDAWLGSARATSPAGAHLRAEAGFDGTPAETWWFPDKASAGAWRDGLEGRTLVRQHLRFQQSLETKWERDFVDATKAFEADGFHFRVEAASSAGLPVSYDILTGPAEHLGGGRFRLIPARPPGAPLKIRVRAWSDGDAKQAFTERVAELRWPAKSP